MNAASPGVIALFQPNRFYPDHETYLEAIAAAMAAEYRAIVDAGLVLQLDSPDLGLGRHMMFKDNTDAEYRALAELHVDALNHALADIPADRVRLHVCWGNYEGPHHRDAPLSMVLPIALRANVGALLFESANPRHGHEWRTLADMPIPDDRILIPGVIDSTTNFIEHPELVCERLCRFADIVGRERVIAGTECWIFDVCGVWGRRPRHRLCEAREPCGGCGPGEPAALGTLAQVASGTQAPIMGQDLRGLGGKTRRPEGPTGFAALTFRRRLDELPSFALGGKAALVPSLPFGPLFGPTFRLVRLDHGDDVSVHNELVHDISNSPVLFTARVSSIATIVIAMHTVPKSTSTANVKLPTSSQA